MHHTYKTKGTCSQIIDFDLENGIITNVKFTGGCNGNLKGIAKLAENMPADELVSKLSGIKCGFKSTSCPDQLSMAVKEAIAAEKA